MDPIQRTGPAGGVTPTTARARVSGGGFNVPGDSAAAAADAPATSGVEVSLAGLLALQEAGEEPVRDRQARRRGNDLLAELAALQRDVLAGAPDAARLRRLAGLADDIPDAADPRLREVMRAIALRAQVELARYDAV
jgi:hypothetical protein